MLLKSSQRSAKHFIIFWTGDLRVETNMVHEEVYHPKTYRLVEQIQPSIRSSEISLRLDIIVISVNIARNIYAANFSKVFTTAESY